MTTAQQLQVMMIGTDFETAITALENECFEEARQSVRDALEKIDDLEGEMTGKECRSQNPEACPKPPDQQILDV